MFKIAHQDVRDAIQNVCLGNAGLAIASTASRFQTANAIIYSVGGFIYAKSATNNIEPVCVTEAGAATAITGLPAGHKRMLLICINAGGDVRVVQGDIVANAQAAPMPNLPPGMAPVGAIRVVNGTASAFTLGTTNFNASDITSTYYNLHAVPVTAL